MAYDRHSGRQARVAGVLAVMGTMLVSACTLVSGWSDLQGGPREDDGGARRDGTASSSSGSTGTSGANGSSGSSGNTEDDASTAAYVCGSAPCAPPATGCCVEDGTKPECKDLASCVSAGGFWIACDRTSACSDIPGASVCCWDLTVNAARCKSQCGTADIPICHPDEGDCKAPSRCLPGAGGVEDLFQCN